MPAANTLYAVSNTWIQEVKYKGWGKLPTNDDSTVTTDQSAWAQFRSLVEKSTTVSNPYNTTTIVSTYSLVYTTTFEYAGGVLAPNGDIHFVPTSATIGQKVSAAGVVSTYSLVYTASSAYSSGVLAPNGDIHFVPYNATIGQKITTYPGKNFNKSICLSPWLNKF